MIMALAHRQTPRPPCLPNLYPAVFQYLMVSMARLSLAHDCRGKAGSRSNCAESHCGRRLKTIGKAGGTEGGAEGDRDICRCVPPAGSRQDPQEVRRRTWPRGNPDNGRGCFQATFAADKTNAAVALLLDQKFVRRRILSRFSIMTISNAMGCSCSSGRGLDQHGWRAFFAAPAKREEKSVRADETGGSPADAGGKAAVIQIFLREGGELLARIRAGRAFPAIPEERGSKRQLQRPELDQKHDLPGRTCFFFFEQE